MIKKRIKAMISIGILLMLSVGCTKKEDVVFSLEDNTDALEENASGAGSVEDVSGKPDKRNGSEELSESKSDVPDETEALSAGRQNSEAVSAEPTYAYVHICGAVVMPGVYKVEADSRIYEVIELAGGFLPEACTDYINQAQPVEDGMQVVIPTIQEAEEGSVSVAEYGIVSAQGDGLPSTEQDTPARININTASKEMLCTLPGIGEAKAESIIRYREKNGAFQTPSDIMQVEGIKEKAYLKLKDNITVE